MSDSTDVGSYCRSDRGIAPPSVCDNRGCRCNGVNSLYLCLTVCWRKCAKRIRSALGVGPEKPCCPFVCAFWAVPLSWPLSFIVKRSSPTLTRSFTVSGRKGLSEASRSGGDDWVGLGLIGSVCSRGSGNTLGITARVAER